MLTEPAACRLASLSSPRRLMHVSASHRAKVPLRRPARQRVYIPGLQQVSYADRMHYVPGLATPPAPPRWESPVRDPRHYRSPPLDLMPLRKDRTCFIFTQRTSVLEGVSQALWLTKSQLYPGLPPQLLSLAQNPANRIPDQDERVQTAIRHARFWDTTEEKPSKQQYCPTLLHNLLHLCGGLQSEHPNLRPRILAEQPGLSASWSRGEDVFQVRGQSGLLLSSKAPLPVLAGKQEVDATAEHVLQTFYPVAPTIDLQLTNVYRLTNHTGFREDYPYPHAHTLYFLEAWTRLAKLRPEQVRAKMVMFLFANALARAHTLYGTEPCVLDQPITVQGVATNGRSFQFAVFQLNTTDLHADTGIKNQVWLDGDALLYDYAKVRPLIKKRQVKVPAGLAGYQPETFNKFLSLYLHGAV